MEVGIKSGKNSHGLSMVTNVKKFGFKSGKRREGKAHAVSSTPT